MSRKSELEGGINLPALRQRIDRIDPQLLRLLARRAALAQRVGRIKQQQGLSVFDGQRETAVLRQVVRANPGPLSRAAIRKIFCEILRQSRQVERQATRAQRASHR